MLRNLTLCAGALAAVLLLSSDASAFGCKRRASSSSCGCVSYDPCGSSYGYGASPYGAQMGAPGYGYGGGAYGGGAYGGGAYGGGGYNPGGIGGPASGLGVRPGVGFGGLGPRR